MHTCDLITVRVVRLQRDTLSYWFSAPNCEVYIFKSETWGGRRGGGCESVDHKFLYKCSKMLKTLQLMELCTDNTKHFSISLSLHLLLCLTVFLLTPVSSLWGVCLSLSSSFFLSLPHVCLRLSLTLFLSLVGIHCFSCKKLWSTCQDSNGAANSQIGAQRDPGCLHTLTLTHKNWQTHTLKMVPVPQREKTAH